MSTILWIVFHVLSFHTIVNAIGFAGVGICILVLGPPETNWPLLVAQRARPHGNLQDR